jgi:hypothetical protein
LSGTADESKLRVASLAEGAAANDATGIATDLFDLEADFDGLLDEIAGDVARQWNGCERKGYFGPALQRLE